MNDVRFSSESPLYTTVTEDSGVEQKKSKQQLKRIHAIRISRMSVSDIYDNSGKPNRLSLRSRCVKRSSSKVTPILRQDELDRIQYEDSIFADIDLSKEKRGLRFELGNFYRVLTKCIQNPSRKIAVGSKGYPEAFATIGGEHSLESVVAVMRLLRRSIELEVTGIFTDHGKWVSMRTFLMKIHALMEVDQKFKQIMDEENLSLLEKIIDRYPSEEDDSPRVNLRKLPLPDEAKTLKKEDRRVVYLLQRLYPYGKSSQKAVDPVRLLLVYPKYVSTTRLFELVHLLLNASDDQVPLIQKQRLLCFCCTWISRGYHLDGVNHAELHQIVKAGKLLKDPVSCDLADELSVLLMKIPVCLRRYSFKNGDPLSLELIDSLNKENIDKITKLFAEDCFRISQALALNVPLYEMLMDPSETTHQTKTIEYFEQLSRFIEMSILSPVQVEGVEKGRGKVYQRIEFWIKVASDLVDKGDFHSALAIVGSLNSMSISRLFCKEGENGEAKASKLSKSGLKKWKNLAVLFSPLKGFCVMKYEILRRKEEKLPVVPYSGIFYTQYLHADDGNPELIRGQINLEKLELIAKLMHGFWEDLNRVRKNRKNTGFQTQLETDLKDQLERCEYDWDPWEVSKQLKPSDLK